MILKTRQLGDPVLRLRAKPVTKARLATKEIQDLIDSMIETLRDYPGVGMAAPQVGEALQIIIIEDLAKYHKNLSKKVLAEQIRIPVKLQVIVNPKVHTLSNTKHDYFEGCLSVDGYRAVVERHEKVRVTGLDRYGKTINMTVSGWPARILQHEAEHLSGKIYIDKMNPKSFMTEKSFKKDWEDKLEEDLQFFTDNLGS